MVSVVGSMEVEEVLCVISSLLNVVRVMIVEAFSVGAVGFILSMLLVDEVVDLF